MSFFETGGKAVKFQNVGDSVTGTLTGPYREAQVTKYGTQEPDFWPDGAPKMQAIINLQTDQRGEDADDDGVRTLYVASTRQKRAISDAIKRSGARDLEEGGVLTMRYVGNDPKSKNPANPAKMYEASYSKPVARVGSLAPAAAAPAQVAPAVVQPVATITPSGPAALSLSDQQKARDLFAMGLDDATVAAALGSNLAVVGALRTAA